MSADLLTRLIEAGTPAALVAEVAMALGRAEAMVQPDPVAERRRAWDRDYRAAKRAEAKAAVSGGSGGSRVDNADNADTSPAPSPSFPPDPPNTPTHTPGDNTRARKALAWPVPEGVNSDHWRDFLANRKSKRLTNTPTAHRQQLAELHRLSDDEWPPGRLVEHAAARGWGAIHDPRERQHGGRFNGQGSRSGHGRTVDAALDFIDGR